jgi:predicted nucleic acid-binding protein
MVLVDTSVWIRSLSGQAAYVAELGGLLRRDEVVGHELVYGELLIGDRGGRKAILLVYERLRQAENGPPPRGCRVGSRIGTCMGAAWAG